MCPPCYQNGGSLLHCLSTLTPSFGPRSRHSPCIRSRTADAVSLCCTGLGVASTGRYPASCPVKPGLSSSGPFRLSSRDHLAWLRGYCSTPPENRQHMISGIFSEQLRFRYLYSSGSFARIAEATSAEISSGKVFCRRSSVSDISSKESNPPMTTSLK